MHVASWGHAACHLLCAWSSCLPPPARVHALRCTQCRCMHQVMAVALCFAVLQARFYAPANKQALVRAYADTNPVVDLPTNN